MPFLTHVCLPARGSTAKTGLPRDWYFFWTDWQAADQSGNFHFTETEIQNTIKLPWSNGHPFPPLCPNLSSFLPFIIICAEYFCFSLAMQCSEETEMTVHGLASLGISNTHGRVEMPKADWAIGMAQYAWLLLLLLLLFMLSLFCFFLLWHKTGVMSWLYKQSNS